MPIQSLKIAIRGSISYFVGAYLNATSQETEQRITSLLTYRKEIRYHDRHSVDMNSSLSRSRKEVNYVGGQYESLSAPHHRADRTKPARIDRSAATTARRGSGAGQS